MDARHWLANESLNAALYSSAFDAARIIDALSVSSTFERTLKTASESHVLDRRSSVEQLAHHLGGHSAFSALAAEHARGLDGVTAANRAIADAMHATRLHSALLGPTNMLEGAEMWKQMQQSISGLVTSHSVWDDVSRLAHTSGVGAYALKQLSRIRDFDRTLSGIVPESAGLAWSTHFKTAAVPALSFLAQDWAKPLGLMTAVDQPQAGASFAWMTLHRGVPLVMTAAVTPHASPDEGLEVIVEDEMLCVLCKNPILPVTMGYRWIGPRRAVRQRFFPPACATCAATESQDPGFLYRALCELTRPQFAVIRGGGQGDGRPRGALRVVWSDDEQSE